MSLWTDETMTPIESAAAYTAADGTWYPPTWDKSTIPGLRPVATTPRPSDTGFVVTGYVIEMVDGIPTQVWQTMQRSVESLLADLRAERDTRLAYSDIMVMPDRWETYGPELRAAWSSYRQSLRDMPETTADPANPVWPEIPDTTPAASQE